MGFNSAFKGLTSTLGGDWSGLQPGLGPAIPTQQATAWATEPVCTQCSGGRGGGGGGGGEWSLLPPPQIGPGFPVAQ